MAFLPIDRNDMEQRGWDELDFLFILGDSYIDHPSFGPAILSRLLEEDGFRIGIIARPDTTDPGSITIMGRPRYGVLISPGVVDSMVNNYTSSRKPRRHDRYATEVDPGVRPDRALIVYSNLVRKVFGDIPLIIGGIEASLRRFAHYDYWDNKVRRTILQDTQADILSYGMGERTIPQICRFLARGVPVRSLTTLRGTCVLTTTKNMSGQQRAFVEAHEDWRFDEKRDVRHYEVKRKEEATPTGSLERVEYLLPQADGQMLLPSFDEVKASPIAYCAAFKAQYEEQDPKTGQALYQRHSGRWLIQNPPDTPMTVKEMDRVYDLPFERRPHPIYDGRGRLPAIEEVRYSINAHRGCFGGCHFCAITFHQGRIIQPRSDRSILDEAKTIIAEPGFKGYIHDVGGPTANFHLPACKRQEGGSCCKNKQCLSPLPCKQLDVDRNERSYFELLRKVRALPGVKKVFVRSGIRFDFLLADSVDYLPEICEHHVSGQLKVAPEHTAQNVLDHMGKPGAHVYRRFMKRYADYNQKIGKKQYLVPYLMSSHPGCTLEDAVELACHIKENRVMPEQVQDFYPTPGTVSTTMYFTGLDPFTLKTVHIPKGREKQYQRALMQFGKPENRELVCEALRSIGREDLIGTGPRCLVPPPWNQHSRAVSRSGSGHSGETRHSARGGGSTSGRRTTAARGSKVGRSATGDKRAADGRRTSATRTVSKGRKSTSQGSNSSVRAGQQRRSAGGRSVQGRSGSHARSKTARPGRA